jgi:biopolymer transport protein ExbD
MRKHFAIAGRSADDENEINLTPMLDVVFIMLIFFIVTATFIRETGLEANRPDQDEQQVVVQEEGAVLIIIDNNDDIWVDGQIVDVRAVRSHIEQKIAEDPERPVVIQVESQSTTASLVAVMDASRLAGVNDYMIAQGAN